MLYEPVYTEGSDDRKYVCSSQATFTRFRTNFQRTIIFTCATRFHGTLQLMLQIAVLSVVKKLTQFRGSRVNESQNRASFLSVQNFFPELFLFFQHLFFLSSLIKTKCHQTVVRR